MTYPYASEENYKDEEPDMQLDEDDYDGEEACDMCGLSGVHKMSCTRSYTGGYCIAGDNCMCAEETQRASCIDWKSQ